ncbi:adenylyl-sulfate kinase [Burkholderia seminalis]|uniref:adenylyl-sulfate kinase n=1 Tax=Burkholderia seminalis TaxID=488731 RepID=UPI001903B468|nr:adenylyl-sulfate kinase [Burkholderia seminalis]MBJ9964433.1 adenylyl-sulfate kinase [Burkholderia seminalis]
MRARTRTHGVIIGNQSVTAHGSSLTRICRHDRPVARHRRSNPIKTNSSGTRLARLLDTVATYPMTSPNSHTLWLTGLSGAGKSTLSREIAAHLRAHGIPVCILDGDELRSGVSRDLGFRRDDRAENCRRTAEIAKLLNDQGIVVIVALISPYSADRKRARDIVGDARFIEIYLNSDIATCAARDPKRLYAKALTGQTRRFTGISDPYEAPEAPDLVVETGTMSIAECVARIIEFDHQRFDHA